MKYIANIITKGKLEISSYFNIVSNMDNIDITLPTLIVGWKETKCMFPEQNILENRINDNMFWTFSKREKRYQYEKDLETFINLVVSNLNKEINYRFFNFILSSQTKRDNFINYVNSGNCSIYYNSRIVYIYNNIDKITIGVSLIDINYIGINSKDFLKLLNKNNNNLLIDNINFIDTYSLSLIKDNIKIVPFLNYLKNTDIYKENENG